MTALRCMCCGVTWPGAEAYLAAHELGDAVRLVVEGDDGTDIAVGVLDERNVVQLFDRSRRRHPSQWAPS